MLKSRKSAQYWNSLWGDGQDLKFRQLWKMGLLLHIHVWFLQLISMIREVNEALSCPVLHPKDTLANRDMTRAWPPSDLKASLIWLWVVGICILGSIFFSSKVLMLYLEPTYKRLGFSGPDHVFSRMADASVDLLVRICCRQTWNKSLILDLPEGQTFSTVPVCI